MLGLHFSALVNKIITEQDKITLTFKHKFRSLGSYLDKGTLIIQGNTGMGTGYKMRGGKITVKGNTGSDAGRKMTEGRIIIEGNAGKFTGIQMEGGEIIVKGKIEHISSSFIRGTIIEGNKIVEQ